MKKLLLLLIIPIYSQAQLRVNRVTQKYYCADTDGHERSDIDQDEYDRLLTWLLANNKAASITDFFAESCIVLHWMNTPAAKALGFDLIQLYNEMMDDKKIDEQKNP